METGVIVCLANSGTITREIAGDHGTPGKLETSWGFECATMELPWRDNECDFSCIPDGEYVAERVKSGTYGECFEIKDVEGRTLIRMHWGNWAGDKKKGYRSDSDGCVLTGKQLTVIYGQLAVSNSKDTFKAFMESAKGIDRFKLTIKGLGA